MVCFFEPQEKLSNFSGLDWPLHVTILDTFKTKWQLDRLCRQLGEVAANMTPFNAVPTQKAMLGEKKDVAVKLLQLEGGMSTLHAKLMEVVEEGSFVFNTPDFVGDGFLPHATDQDDGQVEVGQSYQLDNFSLVDMLPDNNHVRREIVDTFTFKS